MHGIGKNPKDPLARQMSDPGRELSRRFGEMCNDVPRDVVENVAGCHVINSIRQRCATWKEAEAAFDERFGQMKQLLRNHYEGQGRRRGVFAFDQVILPVTLVAHDPRRRD